MAKEIVVTHEGLKKLEEELNNLRTVKRKEVADKSRLPAVYGDLSENAEYDAAKEEQGHGGSPHRRPGGNPEDCPRHRRQRPVP